MVAGHVSNDTHDACIPVAEQLAAWLRADQVDAAIEAGLMTFLACPACAERDPGYAVNVRLIDQARLRLQDAWAARERYRARQARLAQRAAERDARRAPVLVEKKPALPAAAAAILARAKARAAQRNPD